MKRRYSLLKVFTVTLILLCLFSFSQGNDLNTKNDKLPKTTAISFIESDFIGAINLAKQQNKLLFIDLYANWCGPCKQLKKTSFSNKDAAKFYNSHFVNVSIDVDKENGAALAKMYQVDALPTLIIADATGKVILNTKGFVDANRLVAFGKEALLISKQ